MTTQELRIGNYVKLTYMVEVTAISNDGDCYYTPIDQEEYLDEFTDIRHFEPIPLTPEVLEACGFEYDESNIKWKINKNSKFEFAWGEECGTQFNYSVCRRGVSHVNFLHQLQNLYYSLTGQELQIDIEKLKNAIK